MMVVTDVETMITRMIINKVATDVEIIMIIKITRMIINKVIDHVDVIVKIIIMLAEVVQLLNQLKQASLLILIFLIKLISNLYFLFLIFKCLEEGEPKKERYIPRRYNKDDEDLFEHIGEGINFSNIERIPVQVSGENIPDHIEKFSDVAQDNSVIEAIKRSNYRSLTPIQKYGIPIVVAGRDLMASAQTGSVCLL